MTFYDQPTNLLFFVAFFSLFKTAGANQIGINGGRQSVVVELAFPYVFVLGRTALCLNYTTVSSVYFAISTSTLLLLLRWSPKALLAGECLGRNIHSLWLGIMGYFRGTLIGAIFVLVVPSLKSHGKVPLK